MSDFKEISQTAAAALDKARDFLAEFFSNPDNLLFVAVLIALIAAAMLLAKIWGHFKPVRLFTNNSGIVEVSRPALEKLVQSVCYNLGALNKPSVKISLKRRRLNVFVSLKIESQQRLSELSSRLQEELTKEFVEQLGVEKLGKINVKITGFRGLAKKPLTAYEKSKQTEFFEKPDLTESEIAAREEL
mgnify:CR=1 FL=1